MQGGVYVEDLLPVVQHFRSQEKLNISVSREVAVDIECLSELMKQQEQRPHIVFFVETC